MNLSRQIKAKVALLACLGWLIPSPLAEASDPASKQSAAAQEESHSRVTIHDVALAADGALQGAVVDAQGAPLAGETVVLLQARREVARTVTDASGKFFVSGLRGGVHEVRIRNQTHLFRLWSASTAPASAQQAVLLVADGDGDVVRGQRPIGQLFTSNVFVVSAIVAAAVAIPIAVTNSKSDRGPQS